MLVGIEGHQHIIAGLFMREKISLLYVDAGVKAKLFLCSLHHTAGDIQSFDLTGAALQQIHEHGAAAAAYIQYTGTATRD